MAQFYIFVPAGMDIWDRSKYAPEPGRIVRKVQPHGCPKNGTMKHCYIETIAEPKCGPVLVLEASLEPISKAPKCEKCRAPMYYVADYGAPGSGQAWKCTNGHSWAKVGEAFYDPADEAHIMEPGDVI